MINSHSTNEVNLPTSNHSSYNSISSYVSKDFLIKLGLSKQAIEKGICERLDGLTNHWQYKNLGADSETLIDVNSIPTEYHTLLASFKNSNIKDVEVPNFLVLKGRYLIDILHAYEIGYKDYLYNYKEITTESTRIKYARRLAVFSRCAEIYIENKCKRGIIKKIFYSLRKLSIYYYSNLDAFRKKFRIFLHSSNPSEEILHRAVNNGKPRKITDWHKLKIMDLMGEGYLKKVILDKINEQSNPKDKISYTTLLNNISPEIENITAEKRYGYDFYKKYLEPYIRRKKPDYKYQVVEIDGSRFQMVYLDERGKIRFLKIFVILDVFSSMILGFSLSEEETTEMVLEAFHMCFKIHKVVPACIVSDKSTAITSNKFTEFKEITNLLYGTLWREHLPDYPNAKGTVENFFRNFHIQIARKYVDYVGLGITVKSHDFKIKKEHIKFLKRNKNKLKTRKELVHFAYGLINEWNTSIKRKGSPLQKHLQGRIKDAKKINPETTARLCWKHSRCKVNKSRVRFRNTEYEITDFDNRTKWNNKIIDIYYHPNVQEFIFLFDNLRFIEKAKLKKIYSEEDPSKFGKIRSNKMYRGYLNKKYQENKKQLKELEYNDPVVDLVYEPSKTISNQQFERFFHENYLEGEMVEDDSLDVHELPNLIL